MPSNHSQSLPRHPSQWATFIQVIRSWGKVDYDCGAPGFLGMPVLRGQGVEMLSDGLKAQDMW